jgi:hypothetical protein
MEKRKLTINNQEYEVSLERFEDKSELDEKGTYEYIYNGVNIKIHNQKINIKARKYDDENTVDISILKEQLTSEVITDLKEITEILFNTKDIRLLNDDKYEAL